MNETQSYEILNIGNFAELLVVSHGALLQYFNSKNTKYLPFYDFEKPYACALCQGAAEHYVDGKNGVKDFDILFFFERGDIRLPHRKIINANLNIDKFGDKRIDILFRDINLDKDLDIRKNLKRYLASRTKSAHFLLRY